MRQSRTFHTNKRGNTLKGNKIPNFIKHTLKDIKTYINTNTVVMGDFNTPP
jgi:endonuclease/exonuclease/phosphatase family metal-dependent hydrolase